jgi:hypothetical protein
MPNAPKGGKPYAATNKKAKKSGKALGDEGDSELKYVPKVDNNSKGKAPAKIPTVDEVTLAIKVANAAAKNPVVLETIVRQLKNNGLLGALVAETLNHRDTFKHLSQVMAHESYGPDLCTKLVRAMNEEVAKEFSAQLDPESEEDPEGGDDNYMPLGDDEEFGDEEVEDEEDLEGELGPDEEDLEGELDPNADSLEGGEDLEGGLGPEVEPEDGLGPEAGGSALKNLRRALMRSYMNR